MEKEKAEAKIAAEKEAERLAEVKRRTEALRIKQEQDAKEAAESK